MRQVRYQFGHGSAMYILATGMIFAGAMYTQANLLFGAFGLMAGALAVSAAAAVLMLRKITVKRLLASQGVVDQPLVLRYAVRNNGWLPTFGLRVSEHWPRSSTKRRRGGGGAPFLKAAPMGWLLHVGSHQTAQVEAICWSVCRGRLALHTIQLSCSFPFGVINKVVRIEQHEEVLILPRLYRIHRRLIHRAAGVDPVGRLNRMRPGGTEEFYGLRPYRSGDSLKTVDWKHSAKTARLVSRDLTQLDRPRLMLALDLRCGQDAAASPPQDDSVEKAISLTASIICQAHLRGCEVGLRVFGAACPIFRMHHSPPHRARMLEALAALDYHQPIVAPGANEADVHTQPTVVIQPGPGEADGRLINGRIVLGADNLSDYVMEIDTETIERLTHLEASPRRDLRLRRRLHAREPSSAPMN